MTTRYLITAVRDRAHNAQDHDIAALLGRKGSKWPTQGLMPQQVPCIKETYSAGFVLYKEPTEVSVWVDASAAQTARPHRVKCRCPGCDRVMSAGRLFQHKCDGK